MSHVAGIATGVMIGAVVGVALARADNLADERRRQDATVQPTVQPPPPARVILPAPWEPATPTRPATAQAESVGPRK